MSERGLSCGELVELVTDYVEGALPPEDQKRFDAHLSDCPGCATYLEQMRQTIRLAGRLTEEAVSEPARRTLLRVFRDWNAAQPR